MDSGLLSSRLSGFWLSKMSLRVTESQLSFCERSGNIFLLGLNLLILASVPEMLWLRYRILLGSNDDLFEKIVSFATGVSDLDRS